MGSTKHRRLEAVVTRFQQRYGPKALRRYDAEAQPPRPACIPTGSSALDRATGIGGIPRGQITELVGVLTSGMATLALRIVAEAQSKGDVAVYMDTEQLFDPVYAAGCGVNLDGLVLIRPQTPAQGLAMLPELVASGGVGVLVFHSVAQLSDQPDRQSGHSYGTDLRHLAAVLRSSTCAVLFLTPLLSSGAPRTPQSSRPSQATISYPAGLALPNVAALRLWLQHERWLRRRRDVVGYEVQVVVIGNKLAPEGGAARIRLDVCQGTGEAYP